LPTDPHTRSTSSEDEDPALLQQLAGGNRGAFTLLFRRYQAKLYYYLLPFTDGTSIDPDEVIQEVFIKIWLKKEAFGDILHFEPYLYRMARNKLIDIRRKEKNLTRHFPAELLSREIPDLTTEDQLLFAEYHTLAMKAMDRLPQRRRQIFEFRTQNAMSVEEIATFMNISNDVVRQQLHLASRSIREYLREHGGLVIYISLIVKFL
jgi:RNA polymerase sigma-70 factor (ECF subfamily)